MGDTADLLGREFGISREKQDQFALESHLKALEAQENALFNDEIAPFFTDKRVLEKDTGPREGQTLKALTKLKPVFDKRYGSVTVGNACGITDGAAAAIIASEKYAEKKNLPVLARLVDYVWTGCDPKRMGLGPVKSTVEILKRNKLSLEEIDIIELNEAFAVQVLACLKAFEKEKRAGPLREGQLNPLGGAIALGHPVGATGMRLILTAAYQLKRNRKKRAIATLCIGGGQGGAVLLENPHV
jgi:acetyl-CoA acyltransferase